MIYKCIPCVYSSKKKSDFDKHLKTEKHIKIASLNAKYISGEKSRSYESYIDDDINNNKSNMLMNCSNELQTAPKSSINAPKICEYCESTFSKKSNLVRHLEICKVKKNNDTSQLEQLEEKMKRDRNELINKMQKEKDDLEKRMQQEMINILKKQVESLSVIAEHSSNASANSASTVNILAKFCNKAQETLPFTDMKLLTGDKISLLDMAINYEQMENFEFHDRIVKELEKYYKHADPTMQTLWSTDVSRQSYMYRKKMADNSIIWVADKKGKVVGQLLVDPMMKQLDIDACEALKQCNKQLQDDDNADVELTKYERNEVEGKRKVLLNIMTKITNGELKNDIVRNLAKQLYFDKSLVIKAPDTKLNGDFDKTNLCDIEQVD